MTRPQERMIAARTTFSCNLFTANLFIATSTFERKRGRLRTQTLVMRKVIILL